MPTGKSINSSGYQLGCMECHRLFPPPPPHEEANRFLTQHQHIALNHGMNDRCFNCHDRFQRDRLVLAGGRTITFDDVPRLCAGCHGTTYRDWQVGVHGRTTGSWDAASGKQRRLVCTECHDPHSPAFKPTKPFPGPHTLRLPEEPYPPPNASHQSGGKHNPLRPSALPHPGTPPPDEAQQPIPFSRSGEPDRRNSPRRARRSRRKQFGFSAPRSPRSPRCIGGAGEREPR